MTILVTGGAGFIGSHLCVVLLEAGYDVVVIDDFSNAKPTVIEKIESITGKSVRVHKLNMLDKDKLKTAMSAQPIDAVVHMAGFKAVGESVEKPLMYYQNNLGNTINLCEVMDELGILKFVFSSSATVYGIPETVPVNETAPTSALSPYGRTKLFIEQILADWAYPAPEKSVALLRYFNPIGAHKSGLLGEEPQGIPNNLLPYVSRVAAGNYPYVNVFGDDYPTPDGTGIRDYIHVMDLCEGHLAAIKWLENNQGVDIFNLGTGKGYSVLEIIGAYEAAVGKPIPYKVIARRPGDAAESYGDPKKAKKELGWEAKRDLAEMCADSWHFIETESRL